MKAREFLSCEVDWLSIVFDPCEPSNRIPLKVELTSTEAKAGGMEFVEVATSAGFDEKRVNFDRIVPISFVDTGKRMLYGIVMRPYDVVTKGFWATPETIRLMMESFAERGMLGQVDSNHDGEKLKDVFVAEQGIALAGDPRFPESENADAWWAGVKVKATPAGDKVMELVAQGKHRGFSLQGIAACGPERDVEFAGRKEKAEMKNAAGVIGEPARVGLMKQVAAAVGQAVAAALSVFSDKVDGKNDSERLGKLWSLFCDSYWQIMGESAIEDKSAVLVESARDFITAIENGTEVAMAKIGAAKASDPESISADVAMGAAARGLEVALKGAKFSKASRDQIEAACEILGKLRDSWKNEGGDADVAAGLATDNKEGKDMEKAEVILLIAEAMAQVTAKMTDIEAKVTAVPKDVTLSETDAAKITAIEAKLTAIEAKQAQAPVTAEQQQAELTAKITTGEAKVTELTTQIEAQKVQLAEQKTMLDKLSGKRPASRSGVGDDGVGEGDEGGKGLELKRRDGFPAGTLLQ
jgi:hypothetical protein